MAVEYAKKEDADIILVCDPDADRMGVAVKSEDEYGYTLLTGNQSGAVLIEYIFSQMKEKGLMPEHPVMFNTVVTGDLGEKIASKYGVETEKTLTGFKFIGEKIAKYEKSGEKQYVFGYEESYGSLIKPFVRDKDAPQACLMLAEAACYYKEKGKTLLDVLHDLYAEFGYYEESQTSLKLEGEAGAKRIQEIMTGFRTSDMKDVAGMLAEKYGASAEEIVAAGAMKLYLQSMEPAEALRKVRAVYEPKVIRLDSGEGVPVQSNIDGAKYAAFIDESVVFAAQKMRGRGDALAEMVMEKLKAVDGKCLIKCASVEFMSFIEDVYRSLHRREY